MQYTQTDYENAELVFLIEINWFGQYHRFSTKPVVFDGFEYGGSLSEITFEEQVDDMGIDPQSNSASISLHFDGYDMVQEYRRGRTLEGQRATLSYILVKDDQVYSTSSVRVLSGIIQEPIIGDPEEPVSFVAFSLEEKEYDIEVPLLSSNSEINENKHPNADDAAIGKMYPFILGEPGVTRKAGTTEQLFSTPAYNNKAYDVGSPPHDVYFIVAGHATIGETVQIWDGVTSPLTKTIEPAVDSDGQRYGYIDVTSSHLLYTGQTSLASNAEHPSEYWLAWTDGGGIANPYGDGVLTGGGDVVRYLLSRTGVEMDDAAFANIAPILNEYRFAGFVNDGITTASLLNEHILPYLPIQIKAGPKGLRPILYQYIALQNVQPVAHVISGQGDWIQIGALETTTNTSEIYNAVRLHYAWNGIEDSFFHSLYMGPDGVDDDYSKKNLYSQTSKNRYGVSQQTFEAMFIYETRTAARFCGDFIRRNSFPRRFVRFVASLEYGFLQLGDVVELTSSSLYMDRQKCTVVSKMWDVTEWVFVLMFEDTPLHVDRAT